jgi:hypothetical protein
MQRCWTADNKYADGKCQLTTFRNEDEYHSRARARYLFCDHVPPPPRSSPQLDQSMPAIGIPCDRDIKGSLASIKERRKNTRFMDLAWILRTKAATTTTKMKQRRNARPIPLPKLRHSKIIG